LSNSIVVEMQNKVEQMQKQADQETKQIKEIVSMFTEDDAQNVIQQLTEIGRALLKNRKGVTIQHVRVFIQEMILRAY